MLDERGVFQIAEFAAYVIERGVDAGDLQCLELCSQPRLQRTSNERLECSWHTKKSQRVGRRVSAGELSQRMNSATGVPGRSPRA